MHYGVTATDLAGDLRSTSTVIFIQVISIKHEEDRGMSSQLVEAGQGHLVAKPRTEVTPLGHGSCFEAYPLNLNCMYLGLHSFSYTQNEVTNRSDA